MLVELTKDEMDTLFIQPPGTKGDGGFQSLLVNLQSRTNRATGELNLTSILIERIARYAFDYGNGGWENRLTSIFGRVLGPRLGRR